MTPLQEAAKAAKGKMGLPACATCAGTGEVREWICGETERDTCPDCGGCGVDVSDPDRLTGRAVRWLAQRGRLPQLSTHDATCRQNADWAREPYDDSDDLPEELGEKHKLSPESVATALLRIVARCAP